MDKLILVDKTLLEKTFLHFGKYTLAATGYIYINVGGHIFVK